MAVYPQYLWDKSITGEWVSESMSESQWVRVYLWDKSITDEWVSEWVSQSVSQWVSELEYTYETDRLCARRVSAWYRNPPWTALLVAHSLSWTCRLVTARVSEWVSEWVSERVSGKWVRGWKCSRVSEWVSEWVGEWVSGFILSGFPQWKKLISRRFTTQEQEYISNTGILENRFSSRALYIIAECIYTV